MLTDTTIQRFIQAQESKYGQALSEIRNGKKQSHWMWYVFPQIAGLGFSDMARFYAIKDTAEAKEYLQHPVLGSRLIEISSVLLNINGRTAHDIFGSPDDMKLHSCMSLFGSLMPADPVFAAVLLKYFGGRMDSKTLKIIKG